MGHDALGTVPSSPAAVENQAPHAAFLMRPSGPCTRSVGLDFKRRGRGPIMKQQRQRLTFQKLPGGK
jgi:hypothetical protein